MRILKASNADICKLLTQTLTQLRIKNITHMKDFSNTVVLENCDFLKWKYTVLFFLLFLLATFSHFYDYYEALISAENSFVLWQF